MTIKTAIEILSSLFSVVKVYILWILLHYFAAHLYTHFCVHRSVIGFLLSPFMASAPQCQALRWVIYNGGNSINTMWFIVGAWLLRYLVPIKTPSSDK
jgi:hypothetical protein